MQKVTVTLAGREFEVQELPSRRNAEWRKRWMKKAINADTARGAMLDYAPALQDALDDEACYDSEVNAAFWEVVALADPFGRVFPPPITEAPPETEAS